MAMIKCTECGHDISSEAKACPHCGAKPPYRPGVGIVIFGLAVFAFVYAAISGKPTPTALPTPEQQALNELSEKRTAAVSITARMIKDSLREPESVQWITALANESGQIVCLEYRARNGFGGMNVERMTITPQGAGQEASRWNDHCAGVSLYDMLHAAQRI